MPNETPSIKQSIAEDISVIIWLLASINDIGESPELKDLHAALEFELSKKREDVFLLLSLIYNPVTIKHIREKIESKDNDSRVYALEIIDMTLSEDLKTLIIPILDDLSFKETMNQYDYLFPQEKLSIPERLKDIVNKDYSKINPWTKACAMELMPIFPCADAEQQYAANLVNPNDIIMEIAANNLYMVNMEKYLDISVRLAGNKRDRLSGITKLLQRRQFTKMSLTINKVRSIKSNKLFEKIPEIVLLTLASPAPEIELEQGEFLNFNIKEQKFYLIASGNLKPVADSAEKNFEDYSVIGEIIPEVWLNGNMQFQATERSLILELDIDLLYSLMTDHPEISKRIINFYYS